MGSLTIFAAGQPDPAALGFSSVALVIAVATFGIVAIVEAIDRARRKK